MPEANGAPEPRARAIAHDIDEVLELLCERDDAPAIAPAARELAIGRPAARRADAAAEVERELVQLGGRRSPKGKIVRRGPDRSQRLRRAFQLGFLLLNVVIGAQFYVFVRFFERGGEGLFLPRPPGVEGWLPIAALMNLKASILTGTLPRLFPAGMFLLVAFLAITVLFRKAFCSWLCPIGTISEWLWRLGQRLFGRTFALPRWADVPLRGLKYLLLAFFLWAVGGMSVAAIQGFLATPYGLVADVKMLNFFRHMGTTALAVVGVLVALSVVVQNFWCRYLCPYGALHDLVAWLAPTRIRRDADACIDCGKCTKACPMRLAPDRALAISSPECSGCLECVAACPVKDALELSVSRRRALPSWAIAAGIAAVFLGVAGIARLTGHWHTPVDPAVYYKLVPRAAEFDHPR